MGGQRQCITRHGRWKRNKTWNTPNWYSEWKCVCHRVLLLKIHVNSPHFDRRELYLLCKRTCTYHRVYWVQQDLILELLWLDEEHQCLCHLLCVIKHSRREGKKTEAIKGFKLRNSVWLPMNINMSKMISKRAKKLSCINKRNVFEQHKNCGVKPKSFSHLCTHEGLQLQMVYVSSWKTKNQL